MRRLLLLAPLALALPAPASAVPICQYVAVDTAATGPVTVANPCIGYGDTVHCLGFGVPRPAGVVVILCVPEV